MNNTLKIILAIIGVIIIAGAVWLLTSNKTAESPSTPDSTQNTNSSNNDNNKATVTITYTSSGFTPPSITIKSGQAVKIVNNSDKVMQFASNDHPVHTDNPELNAGDILPGESSTITLTTKGEWGYHDHYDAAKGGTITVE
jgi:plastocyanin